MRAGSAPLSVAEHRWAQTRIDKSVPRNDADLKTAAAVRTVATVDSLGVAGRAGMPPSGHTIISTGSHGMQGALQAAMCRGGKERSVDMRPQAMNGSAVSVSYVFEFLPS